MPDSPAAQAEAHGGAADLDELAPALALVHREPAGAPQPHLARMRKIGGKVV